MLPVACVGRDLNRKVADSRRCCILTTSRVRPSKIFIIRQTHQATRHSLQVMLNIGGGYALPERSDSWSKLYLYEREKSIGREDQSRKGQKARCQDEKSARCTQQYDRGFLVYNDEVVGDKRPSLMIRHIEEEMDTEMKTCIETHRLPSRPYLQHAFAT